MKIFRNLIPALILSLLSHALFCQSPLKDFSVEDLSGFKFPIEEILAHEKDKIVVLYTWFPSNCAPCMRVMDYYLKELYDKQKKDLGVKFIALNIQESETEMAKNVVHGKLYDFQLKRAEHYFDVTGSYNKSFTNNSAPQLYIIVNNKIVYYENGFYTKMGDVKANANHVKDVIDAFSSSSRLFDQYGRICKEKKNGKGFKNEELIPSLKVDVSKEGSLFKIIQSKMEGNIIKVAYSSDICGSIFIGKYLEYYEDGKTIKEVKYYNNFGEVDSLSIFFNNGKIFTKRLFKDNKLWNVLQLKNKINEDIEIGDFKDGFGILNSYDFDQVSLVEIQSYKNGLLNGTVYKISNGKKMDSLYFVNGSNAEFPIKENINDGFSDSSEIYKVVETMPRFPGCEDKKTQKEKDDCAKTKMLEYIYNKLQYPALARANGVEGQVVLQFVVAKDGYIDDIKIIREIGAGCGDAAAAVVDSMNDMAERWLPGMNRGRKVRVLYTLPVKFKLEG